MPSLEYLAHDDRRMLSGYFEKLFVDWRVSSGTTGDQDLSQQ